MRIILAVIAGLIVGFVVFFGVGSVIYASLGETTDWIFPVAVVSGLLVGIPVGYLTAKSRTRRKAESTTADKIKPGSDKRINITRKLGLSKTSIALLIILIGLLLWAKPWTLMQNSNNDRAANINQEIYDRAYNNLKWDWDRSRQWYNATKPYNMPPMPDYNPYK